MTLDVARRAEKVAKFKLGGCLKTKHPWILVGMRADLGMTLDWNTRDLKITRVEI